MAPQQDIPVAANVLGVCYYHEGPFEIWQLNISITYLDHRYDPMWTNWRTKKTDGLPGSMMYLWALCGVPFGAYNIVQRFNYPLQVQPQAFMALCLVNWCQILLYNSKWPVWKVVLIGLANAAAFAGVQAALIVTLRPLYDTGNDTGVLVVGIIANILLAGGLLPPYGELWKRRGRVIGINFVFLSMDWLGAFFSLMSLAAQNSFDILGGVLYIVCILLESGIFLSHFIWLFRTRRLRKDAASRGKTFDDIAAEHEQQGIPFRFSERKVFKKNDIETGNAEHGKEPGGQTQQHPTTATVQDGSPGGAQQSLNSELERETREKVG